MQYFLSFFPDSLTNLIDVNTNLHNVQKTGKNVNTNMEEIKTLIDMNMLMGIIKLPQYFDYRSSVLLFPAIADAVPRNRFSQLRQFLHIVDNNSDHDSDNKLFKIKPIMEGVRNECIKIEPEQFQSVDEQIIPPKTKFTKIRQYNRKKMKKMGLQKFGKSWLRWFYLRFLPLLWKRRGE